MTFRLQRTVLPSLLLVAALPAAALERPALLPPMDASVRVTRAGQLLQEFNAAFGDRLRNDEKVQDFVVALGKKLKKKSAEGGIGIETHQLLEILKLLNGEVALVYGGQDGAALSIQRLYLAASATDETFKEIMQRTAWLQSQSEDEVVRKTESFRGTRIVHDIIRGGTTNETNFWMAEKQGTLLLGNDMEWLQKTIVRLEQESIEEPQGSGLSFRMPIGLLSRNKLAEKKGAERMKSMALWDALGLLGIEQYLLEINIQDGNIVIDGTLTADNLGKGLFSLLDTTPADFSGDRIIPPNASSFSYGKIDLQGFWSHLPGILMPLSSPNGAPLAGLIMMFQKQTGLDIEHDLLAHTGTRFTLHTEQVSTNRPILFTLALNDGMAMEQSLAKLFASPLAKAWGNKVRAVGFRNHTVYQINAKDPTAEPASLCVAGNRLLYGSNAVILRNAVLRMESQAHTEPSTIQRAALAYASPNAFGYGGMDHRSADLLIHVKMSDSSFGAGIGFGTKGKKEELGENEISLTHLTSFLGNTYHFAEAVPGGIHHRLVFEKLED